MKINIPRTHLIVMHGQMGIEFAGHPLKLAIGRGEHLTGLPARLNDGVDARRINEIVLGKRSIIADTALRLGRFFGNSPQFWLGLQTQYDLDVTEDQLGKRLEREVRPLEMAR